MKSIGVEEIVFAVGIALMLCALLWAPFIIIGGIVVLSGVFVPDTWYIDIPLPSWIKER